MPRHAGCAFLVFVGGVISASSIASVPGFQASLMRTGDKAAIRTSRKVLTAIALQPHGEFRHVPAQSSAGLIQSTPLTSAAEVVSVAAGKEQKNSVDVSGSAAVAGKATSTLKSPQSQSRAEFWNAMRGGLAGMLTAVLQVFCLMWLRTVINHQCFHGGSVSETLSGLWAEGGIRRLYQGWRIALVQAPMKRFGDTFAQSAVVIFLGSQTQDLHGLAAGCFVAVAGACWRLIIAPLDAMKVAAMVHGESSTKIFADRVRTGGVLELWSGAGAGFLVTCVAGVPWWAVYNMVLEDWPLSPTATTTMSILRNAFAGVMASTASDLCSNSLRVLKVNRQATMELSVGAEGYFSDVNKVMTQDGSVGGLFWRGIGARLLSGALHGAFFAVVWNMMLVQITPVAPTPALPVITSVS